MNLFGKIFTLLIFFLSITFLVLAVMVGASHRNWKEIANANKLEATSARNRLDAAKAASDITEKRLNAEQVSRQQQLSQLFSELEMSKSKLETSVREQRAVQESNAQLAIQQNTANARLVAQDQEVADLKKQNSDLLDNVESQRAIVHTLTNEQYRLQGKLDELNESNEALNGQLARQFRVLNANGLTENSLTDDIPRKVQGVVTRNDDDFIVISLGSDDGVRRGHEFDVFRGRKYIARAVITTTEHNKSAARLISEFSQAAVREGDYVTTKF